MATRGQCGFLGKVLMLPFYHIDVLDLTHQKRIIELFSAVEHMCAIIIPKRYRLIHETISYLPGLQGADVIVGLPLP